MIYFSQQITGACLERSLEVIDAVHHFEKKEKYCIIFDLSATVWNMM